LRSGGLVQKPEQEMNAHAVAVVGAGPAGLAVSAELGRLGIASVVLERADAIGAAWRGRYDRLRLNTCRWTSRLPGSRYARGAALFPSRDEVVRYLEDYASRHRLEVRLGTHVERIDRSDGGWVLSSSRGEHDAGQVVVATGYEHTPSIPAWPGRDRFQGRVLHAAEYRNADPFREADVLVVGPGCSGMEIAFDLAEGGAGRVDVAVRTQPNIMLRQSGGLPGDLPALALLGLPPRLADAPARLVRRLSIGDLSDYGLTPPAEGLFARHHREGKAPAIVDKEVIEAIRSRRVGIVAGLQSLEERDVILADGNRVQPDAVIAATGYSRALEPLVGHLGVLDERGAPRVHGGPPAAPGLRFIGYAPRPGQIGHMGREAARAARGIRREGEPQPQPTAISPARG
jgi:cation diffusion facilitator CzcD-associated flavoprotein CzcO